MLMSSARSSSSSGAVYASFVREGRSTGLLIHDEDGMEPSLKVYEHLRAFLVAQDSPEVRRMVRKCLDEMSAQPLTSTTFVARFMTYTKNDILERIAVDRLLTAAKPAMDVLVCSPEFLLGLAALMIFRRIPADLGRQVQHLRVSPPLFEFDSLA